MNIAQWIGVGLGTAVGTYAVARGDTAEGLLIGGIISTVAVGSGYLVKWLKRRG